MAFDYDGWPRYVSLAERRSNAAREMQTLQKAGHKIEPIKIQGRKIARTFWGLAWCDHLEKFSDYENRLPRGRTYVRNGSVCHLAISSGTVAAFVMGSDLYQVKINIKPLAKTRWQRLRKQCSGQIGSMLELLRGEFSDNVMQIVSDHNSGLFPKPGEIKFNCNCPDWAGICKHIAAVMYGIGARLDLQPELLFLLRNVEHEELITAELNLETPASGKAKNRRLAGADLAEVFGLELDQTQSPKPQKKAAPKAKTARKRATVEKTAGKTWSTAPQKLAANQRPFNPTAAAVARLRKRFRMTIQQFARLLGVSPITVSNWEDARGKLNLRQRTHEALLKAAELTPEQALRRLMRKNKLWAD